MPPRSRWARRRQRPGGRFEVVYTGAPAAAAINDGAQGLPGLSDSFRQAPILDDPRWPSKRRIGKLSGDDLAHLPTPEAMATRLAHGWQTITAGGATTAVGGRVGIDEITPADWTIEQARKLRRALDILGVHAERVIFYASPSLVERVGAPRPTNRCPASWRPWSPPSRPAATCIWRPTAGTCSRSPCATWPTT